MQCAALTHPTQGTGTLRRAVRRHIRQKVQARSAVPFAVELLPGFQVDGTWNVPTTLVDGTWKVPTTLTFVGCVYTVHNT